MDSAPPQAGPVQHEPATEETKASELSLAAAEPAFKTRGSGDIFDWKERERREDGTFSWGESLSEEDLEGSPRGLARPSSSSSSRDSDVGSRCAYVTFLCDDSEYWKGAVVLGKSLRATGCRYPLIVAVMKGVSSKLRQLLADQHGCIVREIEDVAPPPGAEKVVRRPYYLTQYTKLRIWQFDDFDKLTYLDSDMLVLQNLDYLFDMLPSDQIMGVKNCFCVGWKNHPRVCGTAYCQFDPVKHPWTFPEGKPEPTPYINAGFFVFAPSRAVFAQMQHALAAFPASELAEQDFLNDFWAGRIRTLPPENNLLLNFLFSHPDLLDLDNAALIHFAVAGSKPWAYDPSMPDMTHPDVVRFVKMWQKLYAEDESTYKPAAGA
ncbi:galactinol synthase [Klebsormidium nitens]|uniref:Hexosyltransferase n=1 Tax=Klebsormidium nitens TaxID=105231 RepID=A0A1Y1HY60_KLENI|nr:galactinol synthase [Klebsormidium nitens]|eukprot:GAQ83103.1 galactinol synthase [Klebsormidium nitens]